MPERGQLRRRGRREATARRAADSAPSAASACQNRRAPIQPSLSWTDVTPRAAATRRPSRIAPRYSSSVISTCRSRNCQHASSRRIARRLAASVPLDDAAVDLQVAVGPGERSRVEPERVRVVREQCDRNVAGNLVERLAASACRATLHRASHARGASRPRAPTRARPARARPPPPPTRRPRAAPPAERSPTSGSGRARPRSPGRRSARRDRRGRGSAAPSRAFRPRPRSGRPRSRARTQSGATAPASARRLARESWTRI